MKRRGRDLKREIETVQKETAALARAIEEQQPILDEALRRKDAAVERSVVAARTLEEVLAHAFREGIGDD